MLPLALALALISADAPRVLDTASTAVERVGEGLSATAEIARRGTGPASYASQARAVTNWRHEAAHTLDPQLLSALAALFQLDRPVVTRCVKLNNYWCIKRAGWNGEVGSDDEGHTGFASAEHGADAAAMLLRRYYLEFGRRSALDIVRRWAPAECRTVVGGSALPGVLAVRGLANTLRARWLAAHRRPQAPRIRLASAGAAIPLPPAREPQMQAAPPQPKRAQPAQARPRPASVGPRASAVPMRPLPAFRMPDIAAGVGGERKVVTMSATLAPRAPIRRQPTPASIAAAARALEAKRTAVRAPAAARPGTPTAATPQRTAAAQPAAAATPAPKPPIKPAVALAVPPARPAALAGAEAAPAPALPALRPIVSCASDEQRIQNYAARIVQGLGLGPRDDLRLFGADGRPLPNLARVMLAMSSVELGALRASAQLVEGAVARVALRASATAEAAALEAGAIPTPPI
jgi:hypothetical protein